MYIMYIMTTQTARIHTVFRALVDKIESAFARGDAADIANCYTDNGMLLPVGADFVKGTQAIEAFWQEAIDMGIKTLKLDIVEIEQHGDTAVEMSTYTMRSADDQLIDHGKGIVVWKYKDRTWKLHRDIWTSSITPQ